VSRSPEPEVRAAGLVRLGRSLRKAGRVQEALDAYSELAALGTTTVLGLPAELVAREARCGALEASGKPDELQREAVALLRDLSISVRDRGMGIPPSEQKDIFGRFVRGAHSREMGVKGTGLGLAIVKHVVAAHGGDVRLESVPGEDPGPPGRAAHGGGEGAPAPR
jgi:hypothetical protein